MGAVWVLGSLNVDIVARVDRFPDPGETVPGQDLLRLPGGKGANQAVAAAVAGATVHLIGRVGDDAAGASYRAALSDRGIDVAGVLPEPACTTGHALILLDRHGENCIVVVGGANDRLGPPDLARLQPAPGDVVLLQWEVPTAVVAAAAGIASSAGATVVVNPSPFRQEGAAALLADCDVIVVNEHEAGMLRSAGLAPRSVIVTSGPDGARWLEDGRPDVIGVARDVPVIDTTGAGDAFAGALAAALARGENRAKALDDALAAGAAAVGWLGAQGWAF
jgi:ribokinase